MPAPTISVSPTTAAPRDSVRIAWSGRKANRVRIEWSTGVQLVTASGAGSQRVSVPTGSDGTTAIRLMSGRYQLAATNLLVSSVVPTPTPTPPPPAFVVANAEAANLTGLALNVRNNPPATLAAAGTAAVTGLARTPSVVTDIGDFTPLGYAAAAGVTGGGSGGTIHNCSTWAQFRTALEASGTRRILLHGSTNFNGNNADFQVENGNFTVDGSDYTGVIYNYRIVHDCSNVIYTQVAMRTGEGATPGDSDDRRSISFNPSNDPAASLNRILLDHCSFAWGPDVVASFINNCEDLTVQHCIMGPCIHESNIGTSPNGYGPNVTVPGNSFPDTIWGKRMTFFRNFYVMNRQRNLKFEHARHVDAVNNAIYGWGNKVGQGNPRGMNIVANVYKKSPDTQTSNQVWDPDTGYAQYNNSSYFPLTGAEANVGLGFSPTVNISAAARITSYYNGDPLSVGPVATANAALFTSVVNAAGRTYQDAVDTLIKGHALAGTTDGFYNGAGFPAPHPFLP